MLAIHNSRVDGCLGGSFCWLLGLGLGRGPVLLSGPARRGNFCFKHGSNQALQMNNCIVDFEFISARVYNRTFVVYVRPLEYAAAVSPTTNSAASGPLRDDRGGESKGPCDRSWPRVPCARGYASFPP